MSEERPLPPLEGRRRTLMKVVIAGYFILAAAWFINAAFDGGSFRLILGIVTTLLAVGQLYEFRRRTRPELPTAKRRERTPVERPQRKSRGPRDRTFAEAQEYARARERARRGNDES